MRTIAFIACLILSANAAPQKTLAGLEQESSVRSQKLQFTPADAQVYSSALPRIAAPAVQTIDQVIAGNVAAPAGVVSYDQVVPGYYSGASVIPGVSRAAVYPGVAQAVYPGVTQAVYPGQVPYYSAGRTTATQLTDVNGLPAGTVYEHQGATHVGHAATAVHIRRPGQWYSPSIVGPNQVWNNAYASGIVSGAGVPVPVHLIPAHLYNTAYEGQTQWINGQPAQKVNGQWYYVNSAVPAVVNPLVNQYSSVYTNLRSPVVPAVNRAFIQPGTQYTSSVLGYKPAIQDSKWYTKTNTAQIAQPFWSQGQVGQQFAATGAKGYAVPKPAVEAAEEKADWKS